MELYHLVFPLLLLLLSLTTSSADLPSHGCYWTETCQSKWIGGCGSGRIVVDQSDDCHGLCSESKYPPCIPFYTRFHCCKPESPKLTDRCTKCKNKIDFGDEYICCTDCSYPHVIDKSTKLGYCKTRAELALQLKPHEVFTWITGPWMKCSSPCDGGLRYRDVGCFGKIEDRSIAHYPVDDNKCVDAEMPARQEPCNLESCSDYSIGDSNSGTPKRMSPWAILLLIILFFVGIGGLGFAGYTLYKRRKNQSKGFVYIMLEGYS